MTRSAKNARKTASASSRGKQGRKRTNKPKPSDEPTGKSVSVKKSERVYIPQPHGGALVPGAGGGPQPGSGRPPDALRAKLREVGMSKGVTLLDRVLNEVPTIPLVGKCQKCGEEQALDPIQQANVINQIGGLVNQQLKATDVALKYGLQAKELVIASDNAARMFDVLSLLLVEDHGQAYVDQLKVRLTERMEAK